MILISVTSLGRTWPSTMCWRALENPVIGKTLADAARTLGPTEWS
jgi:hypothetical protein